MMNFNCVGLMCVDIQSHLVGVIPVGGTQARKVEGGVLRRVRVHARDCQEPMQEALERLVVAGRLQWAAHKYLRCTSLQESGA